MRLLNKSSVLLDLADLGFSPRDYALMDTLIRRPDGIILVTGPTGSGKTTTLYACINRINDAEHQHPHRRGPGRVRDRRHPPGPRPAEDRPHASPARFARSSARIPDVVMVGEIRDKETVEIAINASLTGHLVLSTIHTNDAAGAITRMVDMGVEPFLIRSSVIGILAQRLVRVLCPTCKEPYAARTSELEELGLSPERIRRRWHRRERRRHALLSARHVPIETCSSSTRREADVLQAEGVRELLRTRASWGDAASTSCSSWTTSSVRWS